MAQSPWNKRIVWIPALIAGTIIYWTLALGLGGASLMLLGISDEDLDIVSNYEDFDPIYVHLQPAADDLADPDDGDSVGRTAF